MLTLTPEHLHGLLLEAQTFYPDDKILIRALSRAKRILKAIELRHLVEIQASFQASETAKRRTASHEKYQ